MLLMVCQVLPAQPAAVWGPALRCQRSGGHSSSLAGHLWLAVSSAWAVNAKQAKQGV